MHPMRRHPKPPRLPQAREVLGSSVRAGSYRRNVPLIMESGGSSGLRPVGLELGLPRPDGTQLAAFVPRTQDGGPTVPSGTTPSSRKGPSGR